MIPNKHSLDHLANINKGKKITYFIRKIYFKLGCYQYIADVFCKSFFLYINNLYKKTYEYNSY